MKEQQAESRVTTGSKLSHHQLLLRTLLAHILLMQSFIRFFLSSKSKWWHSFNSINIYWETTLWQPLAGGGERGGVGAGGGEVGRRRGLEIQELFSYFLPSCRASTLVAEHLSQWAIILLGDKCSNKRCPECHRVENNNKLISKLSSSLILPSSPSTQNRCLASSKYTQILVFFWQ